MDLTPQIIEQTPTSPRRNWRSFTPSDSTTIKSLFGVEKAQLYVGTPGNVVVVDAMGHEDVIVNASGVIPGWFLQVRAALSTDAGVETTAENIMAVW